MKRSLWAFLLCLFLSIKVGNVFGQNIEVNKILSKELYPQSPSAASLGVFGQTAVNYFTGTPQISIPLAGIQYKGLSVNLTLMYQNTAGNKPDAFPGYYGNGWLLTCGGAITLISKGISPADIGPSQSIPVLPYATNDANWKDSSTLSSDMYGKKMFYDYAGRRYDEFAYTFGGSSGTFYSDYNDTLVYHQGPYQHIKTTQGEDLTVQKIIYGGKRPIRLPVEEQGPNDFLQWIPECLGTGCWANHYRDTTFQNGLTYSFIITDSRGVKYTFGGTDESIEFTRSGVRAGYPDMLDQNTIPTTWYLTSIQSPNGVIIKLVYKRGKLYTIGTSYVKGMVITSNKDITTNVFAGSTAMPYSQMVSGTLYNPTYLDSIITPVSIAKFNWSEANGQLPYSIDNTLSDNYNGFSPYVFRFYADVANTTHMDKKFSNKLDGFVISDVTGTTNKAVQFNYTNDTTTRLKLLSVRIQGPSGIDGSQVYNFEYDTLRLPPYRSFKTDKYGYYNGRNLLTLTTNANYYVGFLNDTSQLNAYIRSREPDSAFTQAEILHKVIYPTGGYTVYEYENNRYGKFTSNWPVTVVSNTGDSIGGGLRIKRITNYDFVAHKASEKKYFYYNGYATGGRTSSGVLSFKPVFYAHYNGPITAPHIAGVETNQIYTGATINYTQFSTDPLYPATYARSSPVTYSEVTEKYADGSYTVYKFKNYDNGYQDRPAENILVDNPAIGKSWGEDDVNNLDLERGQTLSENRYDTTGVLRMKNTFEYNDNPLRFNSNVRVLKTIPNPAFSENFPTLRYLAYLIYTYYPYLKKQIAYEYINSTDSIVSVKSYVYDSTYRSLVQQTTIESDSSIRTTINRYPPDMVALGQTTPYQTMVNAHQVSPVIEMEDQVNGIKVFRQINAYAQGLSDNALLILPSTISAQYRNQTPETRLRYKKYDSLGNLLSSWQPGGVKTNYVWGYARSSPVAKIVNASYDSVLVALGGATQVNNMANQPNANVSYLDNALRTSTSLTGAMITTYEYNPLIGLTRETDPKRMSTTYTYDLLGRLSTVRNTNGAVVKQYCYDYAGQPAHCFINSDVQPYQYYWSLDRTAICDIPHHQASVALVNLYTFANIFSPYAPPFTEFFGDDQLRSRPSDGYYVYTKTFAIGVPSNFYVSGGRIFYTGVCSGGVPPFSLKYSDSIKSYNICDSAYPTKYVYTVNNDTPALGRTLYNTFMLNTPVPDGYYLYNKKTYHTKNGLVDSAVTCPVVFLLKYTDSIRKNNICDSVYPTKNVYIRNNDTPAIGRALYNDRSMTSLVVTGYYLYNRIVYHVRNGVVDSALLCSTLYPPQLTWHSIFGNFSTSSRNVCRFIGGTNYWFRSTSNTIAIGDILYVDSSGTTPVGFGCISDRVKIYILNNDGSLDSIKNCSFPIN
ncbi:MAG: RHS repeat protein [Chitinophagaceae bacterium]|nr:RHS repeat protein [Chitinophagaceae bacterium]